MNISVPPVKPHVNPDMRTVAAEPTGRWMLVNRSTLSTPRFRRTWLIAPAAVVLITLSAAVLITACTDRPFWPSDRPVDPQAPTPGPSSPSQPQDQPASPPTPQPTSQPGGPSSGGGTTPSQPGQSPAEPSPSSPSSPSSPAPTAPNAPATSLLDPQFDGTTVARGSQPTFTVPDTLTFGVQLEDGGTGIYREGDRVWLADAMAVPHSTGAVYVEAESAEAVYTRPEVEEAGGGPVVRDHHSASGGQYVDNPHFISVPFRIAQTGNYDIFVRAREGDVDENDFYWAIDSGQRRFVSDTEAREAAHQGGDRPWRWIKIRTERLTAGDHRLLERHRYRGDWHFDMFAFMPEGRTPPNPPPSASTQRMDIGVVESRVIVPPPIDGLVRVDAPRSAGDAGHGTVTFEVSVDGGQTWRDAPGGNLSNVTVRGDGSDVIRLRATLRRDSQGRAPTIDGLQLTVRPKRDAWLVATNDFMRILLDRRTGRLLRITDRTWPGDHGREIIWPESPIALFSLDLKAIGQRSWARYTDTTVTWIDYQLSSERETTRPVTGSGFNASQRNAMNGAAGRPADLVGAAAQPDRIVLRYAIENNVQVALHLILDDTAQMRWVADIENNHPTLDVIRMEFPRAERLRLGVSDAASRQFRPTVVRQQRVRPALETLHDSLYPGATAVPFETLHDAHGGFSVTVRDPDHRNVDFASSPDPHFQTTFNRRVTTYHNVPSGGQATLEFAVAVHPGAWHWVADRYRNWAIDHFRRPDHPDWIASSDGFFNYGMQLYDRGFAQFGEVAEDARAVGLRHIQVWGQFTQRGGGCCMPYWHPSPRYGSLDDFRAGIADVHAHDCRITFYIVPDRVDLYDAEGSHIHGMIPKSEYPSDAAFPTPDLLDSAQWISDPAGEQRPYPLDDSAWSTYEQQVEAYEMDPDRNALPRNWRRVDMTDPKWIEWIRFWSIDQYVERWGADGHYYDVIGVGSTNVSFDRRKNHHGHGMAGPGREAVVQTVVESARARGHDDYGLLMEGMNDVPGQWAAAMISGLYRDHCESVRYTWPDMVMFEGHSNAGGQTPLKSLDRAFLNGNRFDNAFVSPIVTQVMTLRAATRDWIYRGRFMDTLGVAIDSDRAEARLFLRSDEDARGAAVTVLNPADDSGMRRPVDVRIAASVVDGATMAYIFDDRGEVTVQSLKREGDRAVVTTPPTQQSVVIVPTHVTGRERIAAFARLVRSGGSPRITLQVVNFSGDSVTGTVQAVDPGSFDLIAQPRTFTCEPQRATTIEFTLNSDAMFDAPTQPQFDVVLDGASPRRIEALALPYIADPSFEQYGNDTTQTADGGRSMRLRSTDEPQHRAFPLHLEPNRRYRISFAYRRTQGAPGTSYVAVTQRYEGDTPERRATTYMRTVGPWDRASLTFTSAERYVSTRLYLYNINSEIDIWIDDVRIEDLGPAPLNAP